MLIDDLARTISDTTAANGVWSKISIDDQGRYKLSRRAALEEMGIQEEKKEGQDEERGEERRGERRRDDRRDDRKPRHGGRR
jgi:hypothetical protein